MKKSDILLMPGSNVDHAVRNSQAALVEINKRLVREIDLRNRTISEQARSIHAMNTVFTRIAEKLGTPVPTCAEEGQEALRALNDRIDWLVGIEAKDEKTSKKKNQ